MLILNESIYREPDRAPQMHTGTADFCPEPGSPGGDPLIPPGLTAVQLASLPAAALGAGWAVAPAPGQPGNSHELLAFWAGLPPNPPLPADLRPPPSFRVRERHTEGAGFLTMAAFKAAVSARQAASGSAVACMDSTGTRYADLNTGFPDASEGSEIRDIFRESDGSKVGEAFLYRPSNTQTVQHWVLFNNERFDQLRVVRRPGPGGSLSAFLSSLQSRKGAVPWPHVVETCTHFVACPW